MLFVGDQGDEMHAVRRVGDGDPGAAAAILWGVGEGPSGLAAEDAQEGEMQAGGLIVMEALADDVVIPDMEGTEGKGRFKRRDRCGPIHAGETGDLDAAGLARGDGGGGRKAGPGDLLVKERGEEEKLRVLEGESFASLVDSPFPKDDGLRPGTEGFADDGPFFKSDAHGGRAEVPPARAGKAITDSWFPNGQVCSILGEHGLEH